MYYDFYLTRPTGSFAALQAKHLIPAMMKPALNGLPPSPRILEIGAGRGNLAEYLKNLNCGIRYAGIEPNETLADKLSERGLNILRAQIPPFPSELEKGSFDLIVMCHLIEHFRDWQEAAQVLGQISELLKTGGRLLLLHPDYLDWGADYFDGDYSHSFILTRNRIDNLVNDCGYKILHRDSFRSFFRRGKPFFWLLSKFMSCFFGALLAMTGNRKFFKPKIAFKSTLLTICEKV
jgi:SAM-dependent methyltransferase